MSGAQILLAALAFGVARIGRDLSRGEPVISWWTLADLALIGLAWKLMLLATSAPAQ